MAEIHIVTIVFFKETRIALFTSVAVRSGRRILIRIIVLIVNMIYGGLVLLLAIVNLVAVLLSGWRIGAVGEINLRNSKIHNFNICFYLSKILLDIIEKFQWRELIFHSNYYN